MPGKELRRSARFSLSVPLDVTWQTRQSAIVKEEAEAAEVNVHGALLQMKGRPPAGTEVELTNRFSNKVAKAKVIDLRPPKFDMVAVELLEPSETFWGITFRLKKAAAELRALEEEIKSGGADPRVLQEFRDAVDYVRKTAWAVHEWQERQFKHKDAGTVLSLLTTERVRRATQMIDATASDLNSHEVAPETPGMSEFAAAVQRMSQRLRGMAIDNPQE